MVVGKAYSVRAEYCILRSLYNTVTGVSERHKPGGPDEIKYRSHFVCCQRLMHIPLYLKCQCLRRSLYILIYKDGETWKKCTGSYFNVYIYFNQLRLVLDGDAEVVGLKFFGLQI